MATKTTVHDVINELRVAPSKSEQGTRFERLMVDYFRLDPTLQVEYDEVQGWSSWPHRQNSHDTGIDLVARNRDSGEWTAIQCKFYDPKYYLQKSDIDSFFTASGKSWDGVRFANRIIISTTDKWSKHAEDALAGQQIPVQRIGLAEIAESPIDWMRESQLEYRLRKAVRYSLRPHQKSAIAAIRNGFRTHGRGKWISACGTGKTFTSLRLAEQQCRDNGGHLRVLFLAPSISLVSQTLREWLGQTQTDIRPFVVCSDTKASRQAEDISVHDIPLPTTDASKLEAALAAAPRRARGMQVVFSTYQSIDVVATAAKAAGVEFDLVLCDEAHRTTGVTLSGDTSESAFVKVHDNTYLPATRRLYMTATPRIYGDDVKQKADEASAVLTSMDDETLFGPEFHRLGFGEAVEQGLLADYKVMILVVENDAIADHVQTSIVDDNMELSLDDAAKIAGCWNGLAKRTRDSDFGRDATPMKRAVAFARDIKASKAFAEAFPQVVDALADDTASPVDHGLSCAVHHVDGTMNALIRAEQLVWLKAPIPDGECRILSNARCLSEGVDVPALDAVLFLHPRNSLVDVVQSVGRVMRKAPGKEFGYVILPVATPAGLEPEEALKDNKRYRVVWDVLNALRSHDDRFNAMINSINLDHDTKGKIDVEIIGKGYATDHDHDTLSDKSAAGVQLPLFPYTQWRDSILARIVKKVGDREYWDAWADDVVDINTNQIARINTILNTGRQQVTERFDQFLTGLRANLNDTIGPDQAVSMLSQHLITRPVFEALFEHASFAARNPVSITMQQMVDALAGHGLEAETAKLTKFYDSVRRRAEGVQSAGGRQTVIHELYEQFFKKAFPKQASSFGVVYTPVEIVDFILRSADDVCRHEFGYGLTDEGVHVLDPFTGTGTFIVRLLESGIIRPDDLARKYAAELWANEIMLLAYYIACVNIETTYQALTRAHNPDGEADYLPFPGATLTDTFQISEDGDRADTSLIPANSERIEKQLATPIRVIIGNPPYSVGQESANDDNQNAKYPTLDARIAETYVALTTATSSRTMYDSYIRAFRWATDRIGDHGVIAFVSNNGWIDGNTADGIRKTMTDEFSHIWIYNLRGNQRTAGETSRREGGKVFGSGARTGVAVLIAAKNPNTTRSCRIDYHGVPDYQSRDDKLADIDGASISTVHWKSITPNQAGDWLNQRNDTFTEYPAIGEKGPNGAGPGHFALYSLGLATGRDAWCYNFSSPALEQNMRRMIDNYNQEATTWAQADDLNRDPTKISWNRELLKDASRRIQHAFHPDARRVSTYRPFTKQNSYFDRALNAMVYRLENIYPTSRHHNVGILVTAPGGNAPFTALATALVPDLVSVTGAGNAAQFFPRWTYEKLADEGALFTSTAGEVDEYGYRRVDNITDEILALYRSAFDAPVSKDDIFYYLYGVLHSEQYRTTFAADLKRMLPRIPLAGSTTDFEAFANAGRKLADLHIDYETVEPYPLHEPTVAGVDERELYRVTKMRWAEKTTKKAIAYNSHITLSDIPAEAHRYMLGSRSALEWLIDRYQVKTDKASGIVNDPNDWCREHNYPRYIVDLIKRVTRVSVDTMKIVDSLPELPLED